MLLIGGSIGGAIWFPNVPLETYVEANAFTRAALTRTQKIPLSNRVTERTRLIAKSLKNTIKADLLTLKDGSITPWSAAQAVLAVSKIDSGILDRSAIAGFIRSNVAPGCSCWTEIPKKTTDPQCIFISGWVLAAFSALDIRATSSEIRYVLNAQNRDGWWNTFNIGNSYAYASTYTTSWALIGLASQKNKLYVDEHDAKDVDSAIMKGTRWLLSQSSPSARWKPYPRLENSADSDSISGAALHALNISLPGDMVAINGDWIDNLPEHNVAAIEEETYYTEIAESDPHAIDHFVHIKLPWMIVATVDAYASGGFFQKAKALRWLERALDDKSVANADRNGNNWWRAELLISLQYVLNQS